MIYTVQLFKYYKELSDVGSWILIEACHKTSQTVYKSSETILGNLTKQY